MLLVSLYWYVDICASGGSAAPRMTFIVRDFLRVMCHRVLVGYAVLALVPGRHFSSQVVSLSIINAGEGYGFLIVWTIRVMGLWDYSAI